MQELCGYALERLLWADAATQLWRGRHLTDGQVVMLRSLRADAADDEAGARLRAEHEQLRRLHGLPGVPGAPGLVDGPAGPVLVHEDAGPLSLQDLVDSGPCGLPAVLQVGRALAEVLSGLHRQGLTHGGIKATTVFVDDAAGWRPRVTDFAWCTAAAEGAAAPLASLEAGLPWLAPEQTGRMNRVVDHRADLYALGVVLYQLVTGRLPFEAQDALQWVHSHLAKEPKPPGHWVRLPAVLSGLLLKLLAKEAQRRYQSAAGVAADLRECERRLRDGRLDEGFELGRWDLSERLVLPQAMYGRQGPKLELEQALDEVMRTGRCGLVLIGGAAGVGKSKLAGEVYRDVVSSGQGWLIRSKADASRQQIPYASLGDALNELVLRVLSLPEPQVQAWRDAVNGALGGEGQRVLELVPRLALLVDEQAVEAEQTAQVARERTIGVLHRLVGTVARLAQPLVWLMDDLQWLDGASGDLLTRLLGFGGTRHLLVIGACRPEEVPADHLLHGIVETARAGGAGVRQFGLEPLGPGEMTALLADALHQPAHAVQPLARVVMARTAGNPFFARQFLQMLHQEGLLQFGGDPGRWRWDLEAVEAKASTENVAQLLAGELARLGEDSRRLVSLAAFLGTVVDVEQLARLVRRDLRWVHERLGPALQAGLLVTSEQGPRFQHDKVREAAYQLTEDRKRARMHARIGMAMWRQDADADLFPMLHHLNAGREAMGDGARGLVIAELNLKAGQRSLQMGALQAADTYFDAGVRWLPDDAWRRVPALAWALRLGLAQTRDLTARFADVPPLLDMLLAHAATDLERCQVRLRQVQLYNRSVRPEEALRVGLPCLAEFGFDFTDGMGDGGAERLEQEVVQLIAGRTARQLLEQLPVSEDPLAHLLMLLCTELGHSTSLVDSRYTRPIMLAGIKLTLLHGRGPSWGLLFSRFGLAMGAHAERRDEGLSYCEVAAAARDTVHSPQQRALLMLYHAFALSWTRPMDQTIDCLREAMEPLRESLDRMAIAIIPYMIVAARRFRGDSLGEVAREVAACRRFTIRYGHPLFHMLADQTQLLIDRLRGNGEPDRLRAALQFAPARVEQAARSTWTTIVLHGGEVVLHVVMGEFAAAAGALAACRALLPNMHDMLPVFDAHFYGALALARTLSSLDEAGDARAQLFDSLAQLEHWAGGCALSFEAPWLLVSAEVDRLAGRDRDAMVRYDRAIHLAQAGGFVPLHAVACETAARYYLERGAADIARRLLQRACEGYRTWGADAKVAQLTTRDASLRVMLIPGRGMHPTGLLELETMARVSQALSGHLVQTDLLRSVMNAVVEIAGAQRAVLLLEEADGPTAVAEARVGDRGIEVALAPAQAVEMALSVVEFSRRTREPVLIDDVADAGPFAGDARLRSGAVRSVLAVPVDRSGHLLGVLYLEHHMLAQVFTSSRQEVLTHIARQAAISLQNARLYASLEASRGNLEAQVAERSAELERSNALLTAIVDCSPVAIFVRDLQGRCLMHNPPYAAAAGFEGQSLIGRHVADIHGDQARTVASILDEDRQVSSEGRTLRLEFDAAGAGGDPRSYQMVKFPVPGQSRAATAVGGIVMDVTELKRAQREAQRATRAMGAVLAYMSHEVRTPMNGILGLSQLVLRGRLDERQRRLFERIEQSGRQLLRLLNDVLDFSRFEHGALELESATFDLPVLLDELKAAFTAAAAAKGLGLRIVLDPAAPRGVCGDRMRIAQVLTNLLSNAVKFTDAGIVSIEIDVLDHDANGSLLRFVVRDSGIGIDETLHTRLFQPFAPLATAPGRQGRGAGLGLAIAAQLVQCMGGRAIDVVSRAGGGAAFSFSVRLPVVDLAGRG